MSKKPRQQLKPIENPNEDEETDPMAGKKKLKKQLKTNEKPNEDEEIDPITKEKKPRQQLQTNENPNEYEETNPITGEKKPRKQLSGQNANQNRRRPYSRPDQQTSNRPGPRTPYNRRYTPKRSYTPRKKQQKMPETHMPDEKNIDKLHLRQPEIKQKPVLEPVREELPLSPHNPDNIESDTKSTKNLPIKSSDLEKTRKAVNSNDKDSKPTDDIPNDTEKLVKEPTKETPLSSDGDNNKNENNPKPSNTLPLFNPWWALRPPVTKSDNKSPNLRSVLNNDSKPSNDNPHEEWNPQDRTETKVPHIDTRVNNPEHQTKPPKESLQNAHPQKTKEPKKKSIPDDISALLDKFPRPNGIKKTNKDRGQDDDFDDLGEIDKVKSGFNRRDHTLDQPSDKDENTKLGSGKPDDGNKHDADDDQDEFEDLDKPKEAGARSIDEEPDTKPSNPQVASEKFGTENPKKIKEDDSPAQTRPTEKLNDQPSDTAQENNEPERRNLLLLKPKKEDGSDSSEDPKTDDEKTSNPKPDQSNEKTQNDDPERSKLLLLKPN
uniref:Uncharacterized protein n=1 Tax=Cacopsylla melanoneura TaxID=428564 RepID=A0A8D8QT00_9HEMI